MHATPNQIHVASGLEAVAAGVPALVEKPIAERHRLGDDTGRGGGSGG